MLLTVFAARAYCWLILNLEFTRKPRSFSTRLLASWVAPSMSRCPGVVSPKVQDLALPIGLHEVPLVQSVTDSLQKDLLLGWMTCRKGTTIWKGYQSPCIQKDNFTWNQIRVSRQSVDVYYSNFINSTLKYNNPYCKTNQLTKPHFSPSARILTLLRVSSKVGSK